MHLHDLGPGHVLIDLGRMLPPEDRFQGLEVVDSGRAGKNFKPRLCDLRCRTALYKTVDLLSDQGVEEFEGLFILLRLPEDFQEESELGFCVGLVVTDIRDERT